MTFTTQASKTISISVSASRSRRWKTYILQIDQVALMHCLVNVHEPVLGDAQVIIVGQAAQIGVEVIQHGRPRL